jgi:hypothetical protein
MKYSSILILSTVLCTISTSLPCQVPVDESLVTGEAVKLKIGLGYSSAIPRKITAGPYEITKIDKGKSHLVGSRRDAYFDIKGKTSGIKSGLISTKSQPFSLTIVQEGIDTIITNIDLTTIKGGHALIEMSSGKGVEEESSTSYCEEIQVQVKTDSLNWHMPPDDDQHTDYEDYPLSFNRILTNGRDMIIVTGADGFPTKRKSFQNHTKGLVFIYKKKQLASLETYPDTSIWFNKDITENHKNVIAGIIIALLSTAPSLMR